MPSLSSGHAVGLAYSLVALLCWGVAPLIYRFCGNRYTPVRMQALRSTSFIFTATAILICTSGSVKLWPGLTNFIILSVLNYCGPGIGDLLYFKSIARIGAGKAAALANSYPVYIALMSALFLGDELSLATFLSILVIISGIMLVCLFKNVPGTSAQHAAESSSKTGIALGIAAGFFWALGIIAIPWIQRTAQLPPAAITFWRSIILFTFTWRSCLAERKANSDPSPLLPLSEKECWLMLFAGCLVLGFANWFIAQAMLLLPPTIVSPIVGMSPMLAALFGHIFFKEPIGPLQWLGIAMIISGGILINFM